MVIVMMMVIIKKTEENTHTIRPLKVAPRPSLHFHGDNHWLHHKDNYNDRNGSAFSETGLISSELAPRYDQKFDRQALCNFSMVKPKVGFPYFSIFTFLFIRATWDNETLMVD